MTEVGRILEEARLKKGITLDKVEKDLKIRKHYLTAMEAGRWEGLPGSVYATGFLRNYGDYLGLSGEDLVEEYKYWREIHGTVDLSEEPPVGGFTRSKELRTDTGIFQLSAKGEGRSRRRRKAYKGLFVLIILVAALGAYLYLTWQQPFSNTPSRPFEGIDSGDYHEDISPAPGEDPGLSEPQETILDHDIAIESDLLGHEVEDAGLPDLTDMDPTERSEPSENGETGQAELELEASPIENAESRAQAVLEPLPAEIIVPSDAIHRIPPMELQEAVSHPLALEVYATGKCWVEVHSDGELQFSRTIEAGERHVWTALEEIRARFGNAGAVELRLNGQDLGPAGKGVVTKVFTAEI